MSYGYYGQGNYEEEYYEAKLKKRRRRNTIIITVVAVIIILLLIGTGFFLHDKFFGHGGESEIAESSYKRPDKSVTDLNKDYVNNEFYSDGIFSDSIWVKKSELEEAENGGGLRNFLFVEFWHNCFSLQYMYTEPFESSKIYNINESGSDTVTFSVDIDGDKYDISIRFDFTQKAPMIEYRGEYYVYMGQNSSDVSIELAEKYDGTAYYYH